MEGDDVPYMVLFLAICIVPIITLFFSALVCIGAIMQIKDQQKGVGAMPHPQLVVAFAGGAAVAMVSLCVIWLYVMIPRMIQ